MTTRFRRRGVSRYLVDLDGDVIGSVAKEESSTSAGLWVAKRRGALVGIFGTRTDAAEALVARVTKETR